MKNIEEFIKDYLSQKTEYAVQIVGNWGVGKTYFYRNNLSIIISSTSTIQDSRKNYKPIYISLFGLKSIEDIATKVVLEFYQSKLFKGYFKEKRNQKTLKISEGIFKIGLRGFLSFKKLGNLNDFLTDIHEIGKNVLDEEEILICFDDLERRDSSLSLQDLIGYINSLVDEGVKVLIIANEDILKKDSEENYKDLKEKVIGITVPFIIPTEQIVRNIIQDRYISKGYNIYGSFLLENLDPIMQITIANKNNYRHLIYALDKFQKCYSLINTSILSIEHEIKSFVTNELEILIKMSLAFAIEYKSSNITYQQRDSFRVESISISELIQGNLKSKSNDSEAMEIIVTDHSSFTEKYRLKRNQYKFFDSIFQYITNAKEFDINDFIEEFKTIYKLNGGTTLPEYQIMQKLAYGDCLELSDEEYLISTKQLISYAKEGKYNPSDYLAVMHYSERYDNPLELNLDDICEDLKSGLKKAICQNPYESSDFFRFNNSGSNDHSIHNKQLFEFGKKEIKDELERRKKLKIENHLKSLLSNPKKFFEDYLENDEFKYTLNDLKIIEKIAPKKLVPILYNSDKRTLEIAAYFFRNQYKYASYSENEAVVIQKLIEELKKIKFSKNTSKLKQYLVKDFIHSLEQIPPLN